MLNPTFGLQKVVRDFGFADFTFAPLTDGSLAIYGVLLAGLWQGTGLVMVIMLAGLRGIDEDIWKASRVDEGGGSAGPVPEFASLRASVL